MRWLLTESARFRRFYGLTAAEFGETPAAVAVADWFAMREIERGEARAAALAARAGQLDGRAFRRLLDALAEEG